ncbi:bifunctional hydroxymethylpyrimidine kinase/phosphomethylpyrimidine kinase [Kurthia populi]|uniref:Hydroxymethylpyrimidine/phosphomethylpyrimidine kinase n=1 Tax=Kurthia populi TaxID=1562132 RepID=A0ABW5Y1J8_9BACL|nr:bifunctional hydroxymethylpyrimidine kinase/phosphomethylpyrimidine kinase [Candidatus Kurthia intestinigallinarum]
MIALTIAGSDSGGGAGIQADLKTFQELGVFGTSAITALTAQNTLGVHDIMAAEPAFVAAQLHALFEDFEITAAKTGMLFSPAIIDVVAATMQQQHIPLVVDPVMIAKGGATLLAQQAVQTMKEVLLPVATVCTPNIPEAEVLAGMTITTASDVAQAAQRLMALGAKNIVMKGGHLSGVDAVDTVFLEDGSVFTMTTPRIDTKATHGTGCTFSAAITAGLANGQELKEAIIEAKRFIQAAIVHPLGIGHGHGPTNHFAYNRYDCEVFVDEA